VLKLIPAKLVDAALFNVGQPQPHPQSTPAPEPTPPPRTVPPPRTPEPQPEPAPPTPPPTPAPEPPKPVERRTTPPTKDGITTKAPSPVSIPKKPEIVVSKQLEKRIVGGSKPAPHKPPPQRSTTSKTEQEYREEARAQAQQLEKTVAAALGNLGGQLSGATTINIPGPGGVAYANYGQAIISIYEREWIKPGGIEQTFVTKVTVEVARDGRVLSARVVGRSGNADVDRSVAEVLRRVRKLPAFPPESTDATRVFEIDFELKPDRLRG
jgi:TonB family protein